MDLGLKGKKAIVTGGTRGIGHAIASLLAAEGCDDLETARKALREVTWAAIRAAEIINSVERETRQTALTNLNSRAA